MARAALCLLLLACGPSLRGATRPDTGEAKMKDVAEKFVKLVLALGKHDPGYVDAYYGPPEWSAEVDRAPPPLPAIRAGAGELVKSIEGLPAAGDPLAAQRRRSLVRHAEALVARIDMLEGKRLSFDEESRALYDAVAPVVPEARFEEMIARIDALLPGEGTVAERLEAYREELVIPRDKLDAVFRAAIAECRERTVARIPLPAGESFTVEYVTDKPWSGYNWYKGGYRSVIQVNTDLPIHIDRAIDLACHEGYPGHHAFNVLREQRLVKGRGWLEHTVYPLYSPMSLLAEGTANYGIQVAFPGDERVEFEEKVLYPLAGLDPARARTYGEIVRLREGLEYVMTQSARKRIDDGLSPEDTAAYLTRHGLAEPARAAKYVSFIDANRSYVINYSLGQDLVRAWVAREAGPNAPTVRLWEELERLLAVPLLPSDLVP